MDYKAELRKCDDAAIANALIAALDRLLTEDLYLFQRNVHERTISAALAFCMRGGFGDLNVDPEYNKVGDDPKAVRTDGGGRRRVLPDIIVHERGNNNGNNLLVIEIKSGLYGKTRRDIKKLGEMRRDLNYRHALFIRFGTGALAGQVTEIEWVGALA